MRHGAACGLNLSRSEFPGALRLKPEAAECQLMAPRRLAVEGATVPVLLPVLYFLRL